MGSGRRRVNFTSKNRKMQMNDPWARGPIGKLREKATLRARRPRWRPRWSSNFAWPPSFPVPRVKEEKKEVRETARRTRKRKRQEVGRKKGREKRAARARKGEGGRARASPPGVQAIQKRSLAAGYKNVLIIRCRASSGPWCR